MPTLSERKERNAYEKPCENVLHLENQRVPSNSTLFRKNHFENLNVESGIIAIVEARSVARVSSSRRSQSPGRTLRRISPSRSQRPQAPDYFAQHSPECLNEARTPVSSLRRPNKCIGGVALPPWPGPTPRA